MVQGTLTTGVNMLRFNRICKYWAPKLLGAFVLLSLLNLLPTLADKGPFIDLYPYQGPFLITGLALFSFLMWADGRPTEEPPKDTL